MGELFHTPGRSTSVNDVLLLIPFEDVIPEPDHCVCIQTRESPQTSAGMLLRWHFYHSKHTEVIKTDPSKLCLSPHCLQAGQTSNPSSFYLLAIPHNDILVEFSLAFAAELRPDIQLDFRRWWRLSRVCFWVPKQTMTTFWNKQNTRRNKREGFELIMTFMSLMF